MKKWTLLVFKKPPTVDDSLFSYLQKSIIISETNNNNTIAAILIKHHFNMAIIEINYSIDEMINETMKLIHEIKSIKTINYIMLLLDKHPTLLCPMEKIFTIDSVIVKTSFIKHYILVIKKVISRNTDHRVIFNNYNHKKNIHNYFNSDLSIYDKNNNKNSLDKPLEKLTVREIAIIEKITLGLSNKDIADIFYISENTVKIHIRHIFKKLAVKNRLAASLLYLRQYKGAE